MKRENLVGQRFGKLTVVARAGNYIRPNGETGGTRWLCRCDCGGETVALLKTLRNGDTKSCGCYRRYNSSVIHRRTLVDYRAAHKRVVAVRGNASVHACVDCGTQAADWSYDGLDPEELSDLRVGFPYSVDPDHYAPRCKPCHKVFDLVIRPASRTPLRAIRIDDVLWSAAQSKAEERNETVSHAVRRALLEYVH